LRLAALAAKVAHWRWVIPRVALSVIGPSAMFFDIGEGEEVPLERFLEALHPNDVEETRRAVERALAGDGAFHALCRVMQPDRATASIEAWGQVEYSNGAPQLTLGVARNVTEQRQVEDRFRFIVESAPSGFVLSDDTGHILLVNPRAEIMFGYSAGELLGQSVHCLISERQGASPGDERPAFFENPASRVVGTRRNVPACRKDNACN
jgi:PAS domain-containing protein